VRVEPDALVLTFARPRPVLSSAVFHGGLAAARHVLVAQVSDQPDHASATFPPPEESLAARARARDAAADREVAYLARRAVPAGTAAPVARARGGEPPAGPVDLASLLRRPEIRYEDILPLRDGEPIPEEAVRREAETRIKYAGYVERQRRVVERLARMEGRAIPRAFDYESVRGFSREGREKLIRFAPETVGVASRIEGVTPADLSLLVVHLDRRARAASSGEKR